MSSPSTSGLYTLGGGKHILITATTVEQTGFIAGRTYEFTVWSTGTAGAGNGALCKWGGDNATIADGGFDFAVPQGGVIRAVCPAGITALNVIEPSSGTVEPAVLMIAEIDG